MEKSELKIKLDAYSREKRIMGGASYRTQLDTIIALLRRAVHLLEKT